MSKNIVPTIPEYVLRMQRLYDVYQRAFNPPVLQQLQRMSNIVRTPHFLVLPTTDFVKVATNPIVQNQVKLNQLFSPTLQQVEALKELYPLIFSSYQDTYSHMDPTTRNEVIFNEVSEYKSELEKLPKEDFQELIETIPNNEEVFQCINPLSTDFSRLMKRVISIHGFTLTVAELFTILSLVATFHAYLLTLKSSL